MNRITLFDGRRRLIAVMMVVLSLLVLLANAVPTQAQTADPDEITPDNDKLHSIVSSDGSMPKVVSAEMYQNSMGTVAPNQEGNGLFVDGGKAIADDKPVASVVAPGDAIGIDSVIGTDTRYRINSTTSFPYRAIVHVTSSIGGCSGWMIGPDTVATAGHCLHNGNWASNVQVYPGRNGSSLPYGSCSATTLYSVVGWTQNRNRDYDYGAIKLNCNVGNSTGWFGFGWKSASHNGEAEYIVGYPGDKSYGTMWRGNGTITISQSRRLYYNTDTFGGQSGSAVWNTVQCSVCAVAIHAYGVDGTGYNGGTRINEAVFNNLISWRGF